jgi:16S rRNA (adenine1518-N6/adenine1519-N6)-dimethyltransferase
MSSQDLKGEAFTASLPQLLKQHQIFPTHALGQVFLRDEKVIQFILETLAPAPTDTIVEIGAGPGIITKELAQHSERVIAVEIDRKFKKIHDVLMSDLKHPPHMIYEDARQVDYEPLLEGLKGRLLVFGNLPYYLTTELILTALQRFPGMSKALFMVEDEVSERLLAKPGTKKYGTLSIATRLFGHWRYLRTVSRASFYPKPRITSALLTLTPDEDEAHKTIACDPSFHRFLTSLFQYRRKTLQNALKLSGYWLDDDFGFEFQKFKQDEQLSDEVRAEDLEAGQLASLFRMAQFVRSAGLL